VATANQLLKSGEYSTWKVPPVGADHARLTPLWAGNKSMLGLTKPS